MTIHYSKFLILVFLTVACDFTSGLNREILDAQKYVEDQDFLPAVNIYEQILRRNPGKNIQTKISFQLADIYYLYLDDQLKALDHYKYIVDNVDDPLWQVKALEKIAEINFSFTRDYRASLKAYSLLMKFRPKLNNFESYHYRQAQAHFELKEYNLSRNIYQKIILDQTHPYHKEAFFQLGMISFYEKQWGIAVENWYEYLKREKNKDKIIDVKFLIANAYESQEKLKEAYNTYYSLLSEYPNPEVIKSRLRALYNRRVARKR